MDGKYELQNAYANALEHSTPDMDRLADGVIGSSASNVTVRDFDWEPPGVPSAIGVFLGDGPLGLGEAKDRPIGMVRRGNRYSFLPKLLILNFDTALAAAQADRGLVKIVYTDAPKLAGEYTLFVKVSQIS